ncbi:MAG: MucBP domain-containing protein [Dorea sp.]|nr:MucBP domain-containing protein [Dorea sp.]
MKYLRKIRISLLILSMLIMTIGQTAFAEYTYTVKIYAGKQGTISQDGITVPAGATVTGGGKEIVISGLKYDQTVYISPQACAKAADSRYYVKGVRISGRDNSEAENVASTFDVDGDRAYVIAYGISGDMVPYTVNYVDGDGNILLASDTYYGNVGERQYVSARYVDGYLPQAYNLVKTLQSNTVENTFEFVYTPVNTPAAETPQTTTPAGDAGAAAPAAPAGDAGAADAGAVTPGPEGEVEDLTAVPDEDVPQNLVDLDNEDEQVPLANTDLGKQERPGTRMSYLPIYVGIGSAAVLGLILSALYLNKRRKASVKSEMISDDIGNDE